MMSPAVARPQECGSHPKCNLFEQASSPSVKKLGLAWEMETQRTAEARSHRLCSQRCGCSGQTSPRIRSTGRSGNEQWDKLESVLAVVVVVVVIVLD